MAGRLMKNLMDLATAQVRSACSSAQGFQGSEVRVCMDPLQAGQLGFLEGSSGCHLDVRPIVLGTPRPCRSPIASSGPALVKCAVQAEAWV